MTARNPRNLTSPGRNQNEPAGPTMLVLFTRFPVAGQTKTRLIPALGPEGAAQLHREMTEHTLMRLRRTSVQNHLIFEIRFTGGSASDMRHWLGRSLNFRAQAEGDLGRRLSVAAEEGFARGARAVVIVGADCPNLDTSHVEMAINKLREHPVVFGPASDGGYYLVGMNRPLPRLFEEIPWGTGRVLADSIARAQELKAEPFLLPELQDVDEPKDLEIWRAARNQARTLSVIVPVLNEEEHLPDTLRSLAAGQPDEIIVVDGGSRDRTIEVAREFVPAIKVTSSSPGRGRQMNSGASAARSEILLFVHGDTKLPNDYRDLILAGLHGPGVVAGAFGFGIREPFAGRAFVEWTTNTRSRLFQLPYGDQGLFLRRWAFEQLGGFPEMQLMEDYEFVRRLRRIGRIITLRQRILTSGRRWLRMGVVRTTLINRLTLLGYQMGVAPDRLARFYYRPRRRRD